MGGDHVQIPDWKQYNVNGIKELENLQKLLSAKGLKDPWIRNEVWRYRNSPGVGKAAMYSLLRGAKWAVPAVFFTVLAQKVINPKKEDHSGH